jgi:lipopolysaccharide export system protein LptA
LSPWNHPFDGEFRAPILSQRQILAEADSVLKGEKLVVETKMTRAQLGAREVGEELIIDIERYRAHPDCSALVAVVYDPDRRIMNRRTLEGDLSRTREGLAVRVIVVQ